jgi:hypothetical protein
VPGCPDHKHVAQALIEDELGSNPAVSTAEERHRGLLTISQAGPMLDTLAGVLGLAGDESLVTLFECFPRCYRTGIGHGVHSAAGGHEALPNGE